MEKKREEENFRKSYRNCYRYGEISRVNEIKQSEVVQVQKKTQTNGSIEQSDK